MAKRICLALISWKSLAHRRQGNTRWRAFRRSSTSGSRCRCCTTAICISMTGCSRGWRPKMCSKSRTKSRRSTERCWTNCSRRTNFWPFISVSVRRVRVNELIEHFRLPGKSTDEADHPDSALVLEKLENIDSETDNLDITFVKMSDARYARKWGVTKLPAIVYFRKRFPSIYRGKRPVAVRSQATATKFIVRTISRRWFAVRRWGARVAAKESIPSARAKYIHVRSDRNLNCFRLVHGVSTAMFQTTAATTDRASQAAVAIGSKLKLLHFYHIYWCTFSFFHCNLFRPPRKANKYYNE